MTATPNSLAALQDAIRTAAAVTIGGAGTKVAPIAGDTAAIALSCLRGVVDYAPGECVISVRGGTPVADVEAALREHGQYLPFDPPLAAAGATIGGTIAMGLSGPGRIRYGGVRDFVIGATIVDGEGRSIASGGRVVKNAAGFLLHHAIVGSSGGLGALAEVTLKVFPAPESYATLRSRNPSVADALATVTRALGSRLDLAALDFDGAGTVWLRLAGRRRTLGGRIARARRVFAPDPASREIDVLDGSAEAALWRGAREFAWCPPGLSLVKVPTTPAVLPRLAALSRDPAQVRASCGGAVAYLAWPDELDTLADALAHLGRQGQVVRGPGAGRRIGLVPDNAFESRVRHALDPSRRFRAASDSAR
jgi:glycolate oxidase FAD binding subunit